MPQHRKERLHRATKLSGGVGNKQTGEGRRGESARGRTDHSKQPKTRWEQNPDPLVLPGTWGKPLQTATKNSRPGIVGASKRKQTLDASPRHWQNELRRRSRRRSTKDFCEPVRAARTLELESTTDGQTSNWGLADKGTQT